MKKTRFASTLNVILVIILTVVTGLTSVAVPYASAAQWPATERATTGGLPLHLASVVAASATPEPPHPPIVVDQKPVSGEEQPVDAPLVITFDQEMDQSSVEAALTISPTVPGKVDWSGNTLRFTPGPDGFTRAQTYRVILTNAAKGAGGMPLATPLDYRFQTVGYLEVAEVLPADRSTEVGMDNTVTVIFNRPVVPLTSLGQQAALPQPLTFLPPVAGQGEWLNTSIYSFKPADGFAPATTYKARIAAGLKDTMGAILQEDYTWEFVTQLPAVVFTAPDDKEIYVGPPSPVEVTFNQLMDHPSVEQSFSLQNQKTHEAVTGTFEWFTGRMTVTLPVSEQAQGRSQPVSVRGDRVTFYPDQPLELGTTYLATVAAGAKPVIGDEGTVIDYVWTFTTISLPKIDSTSPANNDRKADSYGFSIDFNGPMSTTTLGPNLTILPSPTYVYTYWSSRDSNVQLSWDLDASTAYTVTIRKDMAGKYGQKLGRDTTVRFTTRPASPSIYLIGQGNVGTYNAYTTTMAYVSFRNVSQLNYRLYSLDQQDFMDLTGERQWELWREFKPKRQDLQRTWTKKVTAALNEFGVVGTRLGDEETGRMAPGLYYLEVTAKGADPTRAILVVSPYNMIFKQAETQGFVWITDLKTGQVAADVPVRIYDSDGNLVADGATDADGVFQGTYDRVDSWAGMYVFAGDESLTRGDFGAVVNKWDDGISPWDFNINGQLSGDQYNGYLYTDRPIYRPGQKVYYKGIIRLDDWARYSVPPVGLPVTVTVDNGKGEQVYQDTVILNGMGTFNGQFDLSDAAPLGNYSIAAKIEDANADQTFTTEFQVAEYRRPQFEVTVTTDKPEYLQGEKIAVHTKAQYYFGGPAANATVNWTVLTDDAPLNYTGPGWYDFTDFDWTQGRYYGGYGGQVMEGDGETDAKGELTFYVPADIADKINSQRYTIEATVTDLNDQQVSAQAAATIHKGLFYVGVAPATYVGTADKKTDVNVLTVDWDSQPYANVSVAVVFNEHAWYSVQEKSDDGSFYWTSKYVDTPIFTTTVKTDADGKAVASFVPKKGGIYKVVATSVDDYENTVRSSTFMWITSGEYINWRQENNDRIDLVADKKLYKVGDVAEILIPSPYQGQVVGMLTLERGGIISHTLLTLKENSESVLVPILPEYAPDVYVSVALVKGQDPTNPLASFKLGYVTLKVSTEEKKLKVILTPDKEQYKPGDTVTYDVLATDYTGKGREAELSLNLVDKSVLALADFTGGTLMDKFWDERGVGVKTTASLVLSVDRRNLEVAPTAKGGGGGGPGEAGTVRRQFPETAYWNPVVTTDANGHAQVKVVLPDTLTTWNMSTKAVTADTEVGEAAVDIKSTKPLHVRSVLPRFLVVGDKAVVGAIVNNETDDILNVQVGINAEGVDMAPAEQAVQQIDIPAHGQIRVNWDVTVKETALTARFQFSSKTATLQDAEEYTLPVYRYTSPETVATAGQVAVGETRTEQVQLPPRLDVAQGHLRLELDPSLAAGTREGLTYLKTYPYYCIEQTISRFLPNVMTYQALKKLNVSNAELEEELPKYVTTGLQRIYGLQHMDGGWGWWSADDTNPFLTAYVVYGLNQADRAGFEVDRSVIDSAVKALKENLGNLSAGKLPYSGNTQAFILYVLADAGEGDLGRTTALFAKRATLSNFGKAFLALAFLAQGPRSKSRVDALLSDLNTAAVVSATGTHWENANTDYWTMDTDVRTTAIVLETLVKARPDSKLIPNVVRWLMSVRTNGRWNSTQETAWSVMALTEYMVSTGELAANYSYQVLVNGQTKTEVAVTPDTVDKPEVLEIALSELKKDVLNQVSLVRLPPTGTQTGEGQLYYSMYLNYYLPVPEIKALNKGVILARQYSLACAGADCVDQPKKMIDSAQVGDVIQVKLTIVAPNNLHYVVVEDPLPAGCEALDESLKTTSVVGQAPRLREQGVSEGWGWWWFSQTEVHDDRVAMFASYLPKGTYEYTYLMRASLAGEFRVIPSTAYQMYFPEVFGRGDGATFTITPAR